MRVWSDTSPLNYLVQIGHSDLLAALFGRVRIANAVADELRRPGTPIVVRRWFDVKPVWLVIEVSPLRTGAPLGRLHEGERETIDLPMTTGADLIVMDDRAGTAAARARGFRVKGTIGVLDLAAELGLIDVRVAVRRLRATNFRMRSELVAALLARHGSSGA